MPVFGTYDVKVYYIQESVFGTIPSNPAFLWTSSGLQQLNPTQSRNAKLIYSFDQRRDPKYYPYMEKGYDYTVNFYPFDIVLMQYAVGNINNTVDFEENFTPQVGGATNYYRYIGCKANKMTIAWKIGAPIDVTIDWMFMDVGNPFPATANLPGATYQAEPSNSNPFLFSDNYVFYTPSGGARQVLRMIDAQVVINNKIDRPAAYTIGATSVGSLPIGHREVDLSITRMFEDLLQVNEFEGSAFPNGTNNQGTTFSMELPVGPNNTLTIVNAKWQPLTMHKDINRDILIFKYTAKMIQPFGGGVGVTLT